jgi:predicted dehydrogenase
MSTHVEEHVTQDWAVADPELRPVGIAVVGAGYWGPNLVRNTLQSPATRLTAVCDSDLARARRVASSFSGVEATHDLRQLLDDPKSSRSN